MNNADRLAEIEQTHNDTLAEGTRLWGSGSVEELIGIAKHYQSRVRALEGENQRLGDAGRYFRDEGAGFLKERDQANAALERALDYWKLGAIKDWFDVRDILQKALAGAEEEE